MKNAIAKANSFRTVPDGEDRIPIVRPEAANDETLVGELRRILTSRHLTNGARVQAFELAAGAYLGAAECVAVSSCTSGLMLVLRALGLRGEVILPSFTFHATAHSVLWNGLRPVFADCDPLSFCVDPEEVERKISSSTACVLGVHLFGCPAEVSALQEICARRGVQLVFDAAHAFGSRIGSKHVGRFGIAEVFSFSPTKLLVAGEGGLIATEDREFARKLRMARNYGDAGNSDPELLGMNARMTEMQAALALAGLAGVEHRIDRRNAIRCEYRRSLGRIPGISFQEITEDRHSTCKDMSILVDERGFGASRDWLQAFLAEREIETRRYFWPPVHQQKLYRALWDGEALPVTEQVSSRVLSLPIYSSLSDESVARICDAVHCASESAQAAHRLSKRSRDLPRVVQPSPRSQQGERRDGLGPQAA